jgi:hypothetical protein
LVLALIAIGLAVWKLLRPPAQQAASSGTNTGAPTTQQGGDPKARACGAYNLVRTAVSLQTHADPGTDPATVLAVAANSRLSMVGGASYLLASVDGATAAGLATAVRSFANYLQNIGINALAGVPNDNPDQAARLQDAETASGRVADLCK